MMAVLLLMDIALKSLKRKPSWFIAKIFLMRNIFTSWGVCINLSTWENVGIFLGFQNIVAEEFN